MRSRYPEWMEDLMGWLFTALFGMAALAALVRGAQWCWEKFCA